MAKKILKEDDSKRMAVILSKLKKAYPEAKCSLVHRNPFELLVATILSAQCTDARVNIVTPALFACFGTPEKMAKADLQELEKLIQSTGFYKNKSKSLLHCAQSIMELYGGKVPGDLEHLVKLRGVGRKTANVVLGDGFGVPGIVVDTHVLRLSKRMGFTRSADPVKVELELMEVVKKSDWTKFGHLMIHHGRKICTARTAFCSECPVKDLCPKIGVSISSHAK